MQTISTSKLGGAIALSLGLSLAACAGGMPENRMVYSVNQPVVERSNYTLDVMTTPGGLPISEQQRLLGWFDAMELGYGDTVSLDDPSNSESVREDVAALTERSGIMLDNEAPVTAGAVTGGQARIIVTRSTASVPNCPDWSAKSDANYNSALSSNYGCAINSNMAAMVANPEDLLKGQEGTGETVVTTSTRAIESYRRRAPTGAGGLAGGVGDGD